MLRNRKRAKETDHDCLLFLLSFFVFIPGVGGATENYIRQAKNSRLQFVILSYNQKQKKVVSVYQMMKAEDYNKILLDSIKKRMPANINPVWFVMNTLSVSKEAAYRRLRGEVPLVLQEAVLLSKALGTSLSELIDTIGDKTHYYNILLVDFEMPDETDYNILQIFLNNINQAKDDPQSELGITTNTFPLQLFLRNNILTRFALFKWLYLTGKRRAKAYQEIQIADRMKLILSNIQKAYTWFSITCYIFDRQFSQSLINDLRYFTSVGLLRPQDAEIIRGEARELLDYMEQIAVTGKYENGNSVQMYVSDIHFGKSYHKMKIKEYYAGIIEVCILNGLFSKGKNCHRTMNEWFDSRRRLSTLITQSGEPKRIAFFKEQRQQLEKL